MYAHNIDSVARAATRHRVTSAAALPEAGVFMSAQLRTFIQPDEVWRDSYPRCEQLLSLCPLAGTPRYCPWCPRYNDSDCFCSGLQEVRSVSRPRCPPWSCRSLVSSSSGAGLDTSQSGLVTNHQYLSSISMTKIIPRMSEWLALVVVLTSPDGGHWTLLTMRLKVQYVGPTGW